jgi:hypothetical protein
MNTPLVVLLPLVQKGPDPADVKPGWLGFGMFIALAVAVVLLWLSMRRQLKKIDFVEEPDEPAAGQDATDPSPDAPTPAPTQAPTQGPASEH